jgi:hypothetical protein
MSDLTALIDDHLAAYTEADAPRRAALVHRIWAASGQLIDPPLAATGHAQICQSTRPVPWCWRGSTSPRSTSKGVWCK